MKRVLSLLLILGLIACSPKTSGKVSKSNPSEAPEAPAAPAPPTLADVPVAPSAPAPLPVDHPYTSYDNDPANARVYVMENGLTVYLSQNKDKPRIQTLFAVRTGSRNDPADATGLAHYLEHMLFKGTSKIAALDWDQEKKILKQISDTYEKRRNTQDEAVRDKLYKIIDSLSFGAAKLAAANEYDKLVAGMGAKYTNAYTSHERTVYINDIPSVELEKFLRLEAERFQELVLRLFHTELETVYEEFNRGQDNDGRKMYAKKMEALFPNHTYGTQTTIGDGEHLKNPSMEKIHEYFERYYVPNNCALVLVGDLDFDETINMIDKYYGDWEPQPVSEPVFPAQLPIISREYYEILGPDQEQVQMAYRFPGISSDDALKVEMIDLILSNGQAGLIDLNLVQKQKVLRGGSYPTTLNDYSVHTFYGYPRAGQSLEEVEELLYGELEKIKKGQFEDWILDAIIKDQKLNRIRQFESNYGRANAFIDAFLHRMDWDEYLARLDKMDRLSKVEIVSFARKNYGKNYVALYKKTGEDPSVLRLKKPQITPVELNREGESAFAKKLKDTPSRQLSPLFINYQEEIGQSNLMSGIPYYHIKNEDNDLFKLYYIIEMGTRHDDKLATAVEYLPYLGTDRYSSEELKKEFFKLGLYFDVFTGSDYVYIYLDGLQESFDEGLKLFEHILQNATADVEAYNKMVDGIIKKRTDSKLNKNVVLNRAMVNYATYGKSNPFTDKLSEEELRAMDPNELVRMIKALCDFEHQVFYYGPDSDASGKSLDRLHPVKSELSPIPPKKQYNHSDFDKTEVYFVDYDMVQTQFILYSRDSKFDANLATASNVFSEYFGGGLSSIVFQEIREAKALAYTAFSTFTTPSDPDEYHYVFGYVGTQTDKLAEASQAMIALLNEMPKADLQFEAAKQAVAKKLESDRVTKESKFWNWRSAKKKGFNKDPRKRIYQELPDFSMEDLDAFFKKHIKGKQYKVLVIGKKADMDLSALEKIGPVTELSLEEIFGF